LEQRAALDEQRRKQARPIVAHRRHTSATKAKQREAAVRRWATTPRTRQAAVLAIVASAPTGVGAAMTAIRVGISEAQARRHLCALAAAGVAQRTRRGYTLAAPAPADVRADEDTRDGVCDV
jgi:hypothetical protein